MLAHPSYSPPIQRLLVTYPDITLQTDSELYCAIQATLLASSRAEDFRIYLEALGKLLESIGNLANSTPLLIGLLKALTGLRAAQTPSATQL